MCEQTLSPGLSGLRRWRSRSGRAPIPKKSYGGQHGVVGSDSQCNARLRWGRNCHVAVLLRGNFDPTSASHCIESPTRRPRVVRRNSSSESALGLSVTSISAARKGLGSVSARTSEYLPVSQVSILRDLTFDQHQYVTIGRGR